MFLFGLHDGTKRPQPSTYELKTIDGQLFTNALDVKQTRCFLPLVSSKLLTYLWEKCFSKINKYFSLLVALSFPRLLATPDPSDDLDRALLGGW
jgi:hypothetical protein